jgi:hypothetical protein
VKGAAGGDEVNGSGGERGGFGGRADDFESSPGTAELLLDAWAHLFAHVLIGFDGDGVVSIFQEDFGKHAGSGADVGDAPRGCEAAPCTEACEDLFGGITLTIAVVVFGAAGKAGGVVGHG